MKRQSLRYKSTTLSIFAGFAATGLLAFAITHTGIAYLALLGSSAFLADKQLKDIEQWITKLPFKKPAMTAVGVLAAMSTVLIPSPAFAQWNGARDAANTSLGVYIGDEVVTLLFTVVFLLLFFLIMGGLMAWGYKAFRNEDAAVPMTAFIVGTVIFVGGEVFSALFFEGAGAGGPAT